VKSENPEVAGEAEVMDSIGIHTGTQKNALFAIYQRTPCFGMCPSFNLTIYKSGYGVYEGKNFVNRIGFYHTSFLLTDLEKIERTAESIAYFSFDDVFDNPHVTDLPTVITGIWKNGEMKIITARYQQPKELNILYQVFEDLIDNAIWAPSDSLPPMNKD